MPKAPIEDLLKQCPSIYKLMLVAARRAKELTEGSPSLVHSDTRKVTTIALQEIMQGRIRFEHKDEVAATESKEKRPAKKKKA